MEAEQADFLLANRFLKQHKQATAGRQDRLFIAKQHQTIVGAAWLRPLADAFWLRSLFVAPDHRQNKLASQLIQLMRTSAAKPIVCLAKPELTHFYLKQGFYRQSFENLSSELQNCFRPYCQQHPAWQIFSSEKDL